MRQDFIHIRLSKLDPAVVGWGLRWAGGSDWKVQPVLTNSEAVLLPLFLPELMILSQDGFLDNLEKGKQRLLLISAAVFMI